MLEDAFSRPRLTSVTTLLLAARGRVNSKQYCLGAHITHGRPWHEIACYVAGHPLKTYEGSQRTSHVPIAHVVAIAAYLTFPIPGEDARTPAREAGRLWPA